MGCTDGRGLLEYIFGDYIKAPFCAFFEYIFAPFLSDPCLHGVRSMGPGFFKWLREVCADLTDVTLADEDTNSILTNSAKKAIEGNEALQVMQVMQVIQVIQIIQVI